MYPASGKIKPFERISTGIKGFDLLLNGGFLRGGVYLIMGQPGSGKTIIANQLGFSHVAGGGRALYVTLLAEAHGRMFGNLQQLSFFREDVISESLNYLGGYHILEKEGLDGLLKMLSEAIRKFKATMIFIDGVASAEEMANSPIAFKKFVHQLNSVLGASGCTTFLLSSLDGSLTHPEHTMVDGIISLTVASDRHRTMREIEVKKFRGSSHLQGPHFFKISQDGITIYPRIETFLGRTFPNVDESDVRKSFQIKKLDAMLDGGVISGSVTSLLGPAGSGKTLLGCQFLAAGAQLGEPGLYLGFYESPARLIRKMDRLGVEFSSHVQSGKIEIIWHPHLEYVVDELADVLLMAVRTKKIKRLFIDGIGGLREGMFDRARISKALTALANELRALEVTTFLTEETEIFPDHLTGQISDMSAVTDNVFFLRQVEINSEMQRFLSILKTRESLRDPKIHQIKIAQNGLEIGTTFSSTEALMTGTPRIGNLKKGKAKLKRKGR